MKSVVAASVRLLFLFSGVFLGLVSVEILFRAFPSYRFEDMIDKGWNLPDHRYRISSVFGYEFIPGASPDVNSFGMRDKEYSREKPKGARRILVLGDSITEWGKWSDYLEDMLNAKGRYEILNCAVAGWNLYQYHAYVRRKAAQFAPDMILVGFCLNDLPESMNVQSILLDKTEPGTVTVLKVKDENALHSTYLTLHLNRYLFRKSYIYRLVVRLFLARDIKPTAAADREEVNLRLLSEMERLSKAPVLGVVFPFVKPLRDYDVRRRSELAFPDEKGYYRETVRTLRRSRWEYLDLTGCIDSLDEKAYDLRLYPGDQVHFNDRGNRLIADEIYRWLSGKITNGQ